MRNGFLALATVVACALSISVIAAVAGGPAAKLTVSTKTAKCTDPLTNTTAKCWAAISGSGLMAGSNVMLFTNSGGVDGISQTYPTSKGRITVPASVLCGVGFVSAYAEGTDSTGATIDSTVAMPTC